MRNVLSIPVEVLAARRPPTGLSTELKLYWLLRMAVAWCFVGHGAFGLINGGKPEWLAYFHVVGIPDWAAWRLMPLIGTLDIAIGLLTLFHPLRAVLLWAACWGVWTASLRPLAGQGVWEFFERAGNYGVPLALLLLSGLPRARRDLVGQEALPRPLDPARAARLAWVLRVSTALLLVGHGGFGAFMGKPNWVGYLGALGIGADGVARLSLVPLIGWFEIALGLAVLARPAGPFLLFAFAWKVGTESLRLLVGEPVFEFIERGGSYGAPLALYFLTHWIAQHAQHTEHPTAAGADAAAAGETVSTSRSAQVERSLSWPA